MAKGLGLIGNFRGKFGNAVGYNLKDSNNKQTQGIRIYQPIVKNPKTYAQAEQRAKLAPINATYRALKSIIDRGQEGVAYGNKSRLAWLKTAMKTFEGGWFVKGAPITFPAIVPLSKGSLNTGLTYVRSNYQGIIVPAAAEAAGEQTIGNLSTRLIAKYPTLKVGDQLTFVNVASQTAGLSTNVVSVVVDTASTDALPTGLSVTTDGVFFSNPSSADFAAAVIVSREGNNGEHLRSTANMVYLTSGGGNPMTPDAKEAAVRSYMAAGSSTDWPEDPIED